MRYDDVTRGVFLSRKNRFVARVAVDGVEQDVHVKNTGRLAELFLPGRTVFLARAAQGAARRTAYDLIAVDAAQEGEPPNYVNVDSNAPNAAVEEWLCGGLFSEQASVRHEVRHGDSRFDFYVEDGKEQAFIEVKGVTLLRDGVALFPDAPTERGVKHIHGLAACLQEGYRAYLIFVIQTKGVHALSPNDATHPAFGAALRSAMAAGVTVLAYDCAVGPDHMCIGAPVSVVV